MNFLCLVAKVVHGGNSQDPTFAQPNNYKSLLNFLCLVAKVVHGGNSQDPTFAQPNNYTSLLGFLPQSNLQNAKDIIMSLRLEFNFLFLLAKVVYARNFQDPTFAQPNNYTSLLG